VRRLRLLLDTHAYVWVRSKPEKLRPTTLEAIRKAERLMLSVVSLWEIMGKRLGRPDSGIDPALEEAEPDGFEMLPVLPRHLVACRTLPYLHRDPFDRMLVAQAQVEALVIVTADRAIRAYDVAVLPA
jgi:PIN domain nuclease of toxin-antitoxin system